MNEDKPEGRIIDSITDLMLPDFIVCLTKQDYRCLAKGNTEVTEEQLVAAWDNIYYQYVDLTQDSEQKAYINLSKEAVILGIKIQIVETCIEVLRLEFRQEIVEELRQWMPTFEKFDPADPKQYLKDIEAVEMRSAELKVELSHIQSELNEITQTETEPVTALSIERILTRIEMQRQYQINKSITSVASFGLMLNDYRASIKAHHQYDA
jgi:hypothetical protein